MIGLITSVAITIDQIITGSYPKLIILVKSVISSCVLISKLPSMKRVTLKPEWFKIITFFIHELCPNHTFFGFFFILLIVSLCVFT
ncbi:hypothetical protein D3C81_2120670 [compost metagenome]